MSFNRENITWQSKDGTWSLGFFTWYEVEAGSDDEDFDPEWDVEYDHSTFDWVSTGHKTSQAADDSWTGANPGGGNLLAYTERSAKECDKYDAMAAKFKEERRRLNETRRPRMR